MNISFKNWLVANVALVLVIIGVLIGAMLIIAPDAVSIVEEDAAIIALLIMVAASLIFAGVIATYAYRNFDDVVSRKTRYRHSKSELQTGRIGYWCWTYFFSFLTLAAGSFLLLMIIGAIFGF